MIFCNHCRWSVSQHTAMNASNIIHWELKPIISCFCKSDGHDIYKRPQIVISSRDKSRRCVYWSSTRIEVAMRANARLWPLQNWQRATMFVIKIVSFLIAKFLIIMSFRNVGICNIFIHTGRIWTGAVRMPEIHAANQLETGTVCTSSAGAALWNFRSISKGIIVWVWCKDRVSEVAQNSLVAKGKGRRVRLWVSSSRCICH